MARTPIENGKLLYHLTSIDNVESILADGLKPRSDLCGFDDVAEPDIISFRKKHNLDKFVPFHFFAKNPFDGRVQHDNPMKSFIYVCVHRDFAVNNDFKVIPVHPKAMDNLKLYSYHDGIKEINWDTMNRRDYSDDVCRHICMAECLSPGTVKPDDFYCVIVKNGEIKQCIEKHCREIINKLPFHIDINENMFAG